MPFPDSIFDPAVTATIADARRRASLTDQQLANQRLTRPFRSPEDWRDVSMYFLLADRFNNSAAAPAARWDKEAPFRQGGTLQGIADRLPYLRDLGIQAIWISPLVRNSASLALLTYHGYSAQNFLAPDERFASDGARETAGLELAALVARAHDHGIYVILDIVLNHSGSVFAYNVGGNIVEDFTDQALLDQARGGGNLPGVAWKDGIGNAHPEWRDQLLPGQAGGSDDAVRPVELRDTFFFRRRGDKSTDDLGRYPQLGFVPGDFGNMRQLAVEYQASDDDPRLSVGRFPVLTLLLRIYQYWVARYDFDGFRIDTVKYIDPKFIQRFGTAMNEFAYSIGKKNFFIFGEIADNNPNIASFVGRNGPAGEDAPEGGFGIDAALDFPLDGAIHSIATGFFESRQGVNAIRDLFDQRRGEEDELISTHGDASAYFVTFVDNHDRHERIRHPSSPDAEARLCLALPYVLPGIPCLYYGDEQDLKGTVDDGGSPTLGTFESVREALWGKFPPAGTALPQNGGTYLMLQALCNLRGASGPLKYGRYYFRQVSGDGANFGWSMDRGGVLALSRIHADEEVLIVCTPNPFQGWSGWVEVDASMTPDGASWRVTFSTLGNGGGGATRTASTHPPRRAVPVTLASNELQILQRV
jgi:Alpha amylase, catalytic domain